MSIDHILHTDTLRAGNEKLVESSVSKKLYGSKKQHGCTKTFWLFLKNPVSMILDVRREVKSFEMLVDEANERAKKPWY